MQVIFIGDIGMSGFDFSLISPEAVRDILEYARKRNDETYARLIHYGNYRVTSADLSRSVSDYVWAHCDPGEGNLLLQRVHVLANQLVTQRGREGAASAFAEVMANYCTSEEGLSEHTAWLARAAEERQRTPEGRDDLDSARMIRYASRDQHIENLKRRLSNDLPRTQAVKKVLDMCASGWEAMRPAARLSAAGMLVVAREPRIA
jgi:hypothetical protein